MINLTNYSSSGLGNALNQGLSGMLNSQRNIAESANELVRSGTVERTHTTTDIVEPIVEMAEQQHIFDASAKVVKMADRALGELIDIKT